MLDEIREVLVREGIRIAAIIDDVYDETPTLADIEPDQWNIFETDLTDVEIGLVEGELGVADVYAELPALKLDPDFLDFLWRTRDRSSVLVALFKPFEDRQSAGRKLLTPLERLLTDLGLALRTGGSREAETGKGGIQDAQLIFLDLFLGARQDEEARKRAVDRVGRIIEQRRSSPPLVVLMSSSTRLDEFRDTCRDEATLLGCQFRTLQKLDIDVNESERLHELLFRLASRYQDTLRLAAFMDTWRRALDGATDRFLSRVRRLDLRDYADIQELVLNSQGEHVGTYLLEAYDQFFHYELESDKGLRDAGRAIDQIAWKDYPPPHFLPEAVGREIVDGLLFHHADLVSLGDPVGFGDIYFVMRPEAWPSDSEPRISIASGERLALVVLTQACDIQQGTAKRLLFMAGVARPAALVFHRRPEALLTPTLVIGDISYVVNWDVGVPVAWSLAELKTLVDRGDYSRVRRFRPLHALQLQQCFAGALSRVGVPVMFPPQHVVGVDLSYRDKDGEVRLLTSAAAEDREAVAMVGRDEQRHTDHLVLSGSLTARLKVAMRAVDVAILAEKQRSAWSTALASREFFGRLEQGVVYDRTSSKRSLKGTSFDIVQVVGPFMKEHRPIVDGKARGDAGPLLIEIRLSASSESATVDNGASGTGPDRSGSHE